MPETTDIPLLLHHFTSSEVFLSFLLLSMTLKCYFLLFFFFSYLLSIYLELVGCLASACFLIWNHQGKLGLDHSREEKFSSLKLSTRMQRFFLLHLVLTLVPSVSSHSPLCFISSLCLSSPLIFLLLLKNQISFEAILFFFFLCRRQTHSNAFL